MRNEKGERLFRAMDGIDDEMIAAAEPKPEGKERARVKHPVRRFIALAASIAIIVGLSLYLFIPINDAPRISAYRGDEYYPLIEAIAYAYYTPSRYKNNFDRLTSSLVKMDGASGNGTDGASAPSDTGANGSYTEVTDNQVEGVIEADLVKATDKYIFRLSVDRSAGDTLYLRVYTIDGIDSQRLAELELMSASADKYVSFNTAEMFLSQDASRITVVQTYKDKQYQEYTYVQSIDVSDVTNMSILDTLTVSGKYADSRMANGRLLLASCYSPTVSRIKYAEPATYVPTIDRGEGAELVPMSDIVMPSKASNAKYTVLTLISEDGLELIDNLALFNFTDSLYATEEGMYLVHSYRDGLQLDNGRYYDFVRFSEIVCMSWGEDALEHRGSLTVEGTVKDQYSLDEREGYLRVVTTTATSINGEGNRVYEDDASLFVFDLSDMTLRASVEYFAPLGESAESVRFDGDKLYVCTAEIVSMTDPVYFFDLSDYDNITSTDTGTIDGFSSTLIQLKDGYLLGIGVDGYDNQKIEVYARENDSVVSVDALVFDGVVPTEYKAIFIDRELSLVGMMIGGYRELDDDYYYGANSPSGDLYVLFCFNGTELARLDAVALSNEAPDRVRALYLDGYLYVIGDNGLTVMSLNYN